MIVGLRLGDRTHRNDRNGSHGNPKCQPQDASSLEVVELRCLWAIATHR
jgi:hypothetical protein